MKSLPTLPTSNDVLIPWQNLFYSLADKQTGKDLRPDVIPITFADLGFKVGTGGVSGICRVFTRSDGSVAMKYIEIDPQFWSVTDDTPHEVVVLHEMGHCSLHRPHRTDQTAGIAASIMYPQVLSTSTYLPNRSNYISELFANSYIVDPTAAKYFSYFFPDNKDQNVYFRHDIKSVYDRLGFHHCEED